jgi:hypothetical protein
MPGNAQLIGVYTVPLSDELIAAQTRELYGSNPSPPQVAQVREQLASVALIEVLVSGADTQFSVSDFAQADPEKPRSDWQAAYAEAFLSPDGESLLVARWKRLPAGLTDFRVAFYMYYWKVGQPLLSSYGSLETPPPSQMPERLSRLAPYEMVD